MQFFISLSENNLEKVFVGYIQQTNSDGNVPRSSANGLHWEYKHFKVLQFKWLWPYRSMWCHV